ncbi:unnamed protein product [Ambrosiozyma monospora]|uniref:Unnamed protein product n=1 Tax=Ambrosiozyma monospora TaxID=43982 RepID=A0ACB5U9S8_AMBMO|nr:unnamed protein product [Ambrosiozyma monospora]
MLSWDVARHVFREVVVGLEYLHKQGIIHRDIKPSNLLVSKDNVVKISDFGISFAANLLDSEDADVIAANGIELAKTAGTPAFLAPELCRTESVGPEVKVTHKIDIWALGVTLYCLLFGDLPFYAESEFALFDAINHNDFFIPDTTKWKIAASIPKFQLNMAVDLLEGLLQKDPVKRIDIPDIKTYDFFNEGCR